MVNLVAGCNPVDERGRGEFLERKKGLLHGMYKQPWLSCLWTGNNENSKFSIKMYMNGTLFLLAFCIQIALVSTSNPHEPMLWKLYNLQDSKLIQTQQGPGNNWNFSVHLFSLIPFETEGCRHSNCLNLLKQNAQCKAFYICPASNPGKSYCNYPGHFYCGYWGCETIASDWKTPGDKYITVTWGPPGCRPPQHSFDGEVVGSCGPPSTCSRVEIKVKNPDDEHWLVGKIWGIRCWEPRADRGSLFKIIKERLPHDPFPIGPNPVLNPSVVTPPIRLNQSLSPSIATPYQSKTLQLLTTVSPEGRINTKTVESLMKPENSLWKLMQASYLALNNTKPNLTQECWLCYSAKPPYFEATGRHDRVRWSNGSNPRECPWNDQRNHTQGITVQLVTGQGKCVGTVPKIYRQLCNQTISNTKVRSYKSRNNKWLIPAQGAKWVCSDIGVTPCISLNVFNQSQFCIQVIIVPRLMYHTSEEELHHFEVGLNRQKREPITAITLATLLIAGGVGAGTGIASLVKNQELQALQVAVDEDLAKIEQSIQKLAASVKSLSEVVLQKRRGLDLLFLKEGGLCVALNEECCSFADHTGLVQDAMTELRKRLEQQKKDREAGKAWYENWFNASPWLTTLLSTLAGPLIMLILALIVGPCILRNIVRFVEARFNAAKLLILQTRYENVSENENNENEDWIECNSFEWIECNSECESFKYERP